MAAGLLHFFVLRVKCFILVYVHHTGEGAVHAPPQTYLNIFESNFYLQNLKVYNACQGLPMKKYIEVNEQVIKNMGTYWNIRCC